MGDKKFVVIPEIRGSHGGITVAIKNALFRDDGKWKSAVIQLQARSLRPEEWKQNDD